MSQVNTSLLISITSKSKTVKTKAGAVVLMIWTEPITTQPSSISTASTRTEQQKKQMGSILEVAGGALGGRQREERAILINLWICMFQYVLGEKSGNVWM